MIVENFHKIGRIFFETERLIVAHLNRSDFGTIREIQRDKRTMEFFASKPGARLTDKEIASNFNIIIAHCDQFKFSYGPIFEKSTGTLIGNAGISHLDFNPEDPTIEIGYFLLPEFWGRGFAGELAPHLIEIALKLKAPKVVATVDASNIASCKICEKMNMIFEGQFPYATLQGKMLNNYAAYPDWVNPEHQTSVLNNCRSQLPTPSNRTVFKCMGPKGSTIFAVPAVSLSATADPKLIRAAIDTHNITLIHTDAAEPENQKLIQVAISDFPREHLILTASNRTLNQAAFEATCEHLGTHYLDIYYLDGLTKESTTSVMNTMLELQQTKRIHSISLAHVSPTVIKAAHAICPITSVLVEYSLWNRSSISEETLETCKTFGISCISTAALPTEQSHLRALEALANLEKCVPEQIAQAWVLQQGCLIQSTARNSAELVRDVASATLKLSPETLSKLDKLFPKK